MKTIRFPGFFLIALLCFAASAEAQRTKRPVKRPTVITTSTSAVEIKASKEKVSNQIANVTRFIDVLGKVAIGIENVDKEARRKKVPAKTIADNEANKRKVIQAIRNLRAGLAALEVEFRTKLVLKKFLVPIQGITDLSAQSEDAALAGRFTEAGDPLLIVVEKLSNTLVAMP